MEIVHIPHLSPVRRSQLMLLINACDGYDPFIEEDGVLPVQYAAFCNQQMVGFLSILVTEHEAEVTALVAPEFRRRGIFTKMLLKARSNPTFYMNTPLICAVPDTFFSASDTPGFVSAPAFTELLLKCDKNIASLVSSKIFSINSSKMSAAYTCCFSQDNTEYLMYTASAYDSAENEEPVAVCSLDYQPSFCMIYGVFVDLPLRGQGVGTQFMLHLIADYFSLQDLPLLLNVRSTNIPALALYKKCGFAETSHIHYYYI